MSSEVSIFDLLEFSVGYKFGLLGRLYLGRLYLGGLAKNLKHLGIERHFSVLVLLDKMGDHCSQKFLADTLHMDKTMMVGVIDNLGEKGFIKRTQNPKDRREYWIQLTPKGKKHMPEIKATVNKMNTASMQGMLPLETKQLHKQLHLIYKNLKRISQSS